MSLTLEDARKAIAAAITKAEEINTKMDIAVVDRGGNLVAFERMDGAWIGSIDIAIDKAWTANAFDMATHDLGKLAQPVEDNICYGIHTTNNARVVIFGGGVPIKKGDEIVGGIGVSGGYAETEDLPVAAAGAAAVS